MKDSEVISALVRWVATHTETPVIQADQNGDNPPLPYIVVRLLATDMVRDQAQMTDFEEDEESERVKASPVVETEWRFSVHAFGNNPFDILRPIRSAADLAQANEPLMPALVIHELSPMRNLSAVVNEKWEPRAQMDLALRGLVRDGVIIDTIEKYQFDFTRV